MNVPVQVIKYDISSMNPAYVDYIQSEKDNDTRKFRVKFYSHDTLITLSNSCTATATITIDNVMIEQELACTITDNSVEVTANATRDGVMAVQITLTDGDDKLTMQRPIFVRVTNDIAETAQIDDDSHGSFAEVVQELADARGDYISLSEALNHKLSSAAGAVKTANIDTGAVTEAKLATAFKDTLYKVNTIDWEPPNYRTCEAKTIYIGVKLGNERGIIIPFYWKEKQIFIGFNGTICVRQFVGGNDYQNWGPNLSELTANKKSSITSNNQASTDFFPSIKAVVDYIAALFATVINNDNKSSNALLPTIKAVADYLTANYTDTTALNTLLNTRLSSKADASYVDSRLNSKADSSALTAKEDLSNKIITGENLYNNKNSTDKYPAAKAIVDYLMQYYANKNDQEYLQERISDIKAYLGYTSSDILGLQVDFVNNRFTRLAGAEEREAGSDFDAFPMFGGRRRCCVANDGTINAYYGEQGYAEDGTNGQVMVYQPKFYYRMVPLKLEKQASGLGYHIRKANYYVTANPHPGFKLHPLFYDANGNEVDYVLLSAYEGSMYDVSASAYVNDNIDTSVSYGTGDLLCSVAGKKPISGRQSNISSRPQLETMANNLGSGWHLNTVKAESANQLLMMIELGTLNTQTAIGQGITTCPNNGSYNCSSYTGATASLGNATGMATETVYEAGGTETTYTVNGKLSVSYRGVENPWGNIWKATNGINIWGDGNMYGGQVFICDDFAYSENKKNENYKSAGFTIPNGTGYISAFGYGSEDYDWILMPSENTGSSALPVGDKCTNASDVVTYYVARIGGDWSGGDADGGFCWQCLHGNGYQTQRFGGRLLYVPTA